MKEMAKKETHLQSLSDTEQRSSLKANWFDRFKRFGRSKPKTTPSSQPVFVNETWILRD